MIPFFLGLELLPGRRDRGLIDQRLGACDRRRRVLRQPFGEFARLGLQLRCRNDTGDQAPLIGLLCGKTVLGQKDLQRAAGADGADHADRAAAVGRDADLGIGRREAGVIGGNAEVGDEGQPHTGAGGGAVHAGEHDLRHPPHRLDEGVVVLQQLADHRRDGIVGGGGADGLQIAAGREGAAFTLDHQHTDIVVALDLRAELLELLRNRQIDGIEGRGPVQGDGGDRTLDPEQGGGVGGGII